jgi:DNA-directed RNA polymerase alpha subunit
MRRVESEIDYLELSIRASNALADAGITTYKQIYGMTRLEIKSLPNIGEKTATEIEDALINPRPCRDMKPQIEKIEDEISTRKKWIRAMKKEVRSIEKLMKLASLRGDVIRSL